MAAPDKHTCKVLVCPDCGKRYSAEKLELLVFNPFPSKKKAREGQE